MYSSRCCRDIGLLGRSGHGDEAGEFPHKEPVNACFHLYQVIAGALTTHRQWNTILTCSITGATANRTSAKEKEQGGIGWASTFNERDGARNAG
jgi:hypothetical protein